MVIPELHLIESEICLVSAAELPAVFTLFDEMLTFG